MNATNQNTLVWMSNRTRTWSPHATKIQRYLHRIFLYSCNGESMFIHWGLCQSSESQFAINLAMSGEALVERQCSMLTIVYIVHWYIRCSVYCMLIYVVQCKYWWTLYSVPWYTLYSVSCWTLFSVSWCLLFSVPWCILCSLYIDVYGAVYPDLYTALCILIYAVRCILMYKALCILIYTLRCILMHCILRSVYNDVCIQDVYCTVYPAVHFAVYPDLYYTVHTVDIVCDLIYTVKSILKCTVQCSRLRVYTEVY